MDKVEECFKVIGIKPNITKVILHLYSNKEATFREIESKQQLRQPEASVAICYLRGLGVLEEVIVKETQRGRPVTLCRLKPDVNEILTIKKNEVENNYSKQIEAIEELERFFQKV